MGSRWAGLRRGTCVTVLSALLGLSGCGGSDDSVSAQAVADDAVSVIDSADDSESERMEAMSVAASVTLTSSTLGLTVVNFPVLHQLVPRENIGDSTASLSFTVRSASKAVRSLSLTTTVDGVATIGSPVAIRPGESIRMTLSVPVGLQAAAYMLTAHSEDAGSTTDAVVAQADDVVAGDVYVVTGQSNALAMKHPQEFAAVASDAASPWIRTVGGMVYTSPSDSADHAWHVARAGPASGALGSLGTVGEWALRMAADLVESQHVPIAILNGGKGALPIAEFLPQAGGLSNNYRRLMGRLDAYGLAASVRAVFLYQGEADIHDDDPPKWRGKFDALLQAWRASFPKLAHVYVTQIRGCNDVSGTRTIREAQRQVSTPLARPDVQVMSTTGMTGFDGGCHFYYAGYRQLGHWYANLLAHDVYGAGGDAAASIDAPAPAQIQRGVGNKQLFIWLANQADPITADVGSNQDFVVTSTTGSTYQPTRVAASAGLITLTLPAPAATAVSVSYRGQSDARGHRWITNANGIGLLGFEALPVQP